MATINLQTLPNDVLSKIPMYLRLNKNEYEIKELPLEIQYLVKDYLSTKNLTIDYTDIYDTKPELSVYNDLAVIKDEKILLLNYFKNYLLTKVGSYPFDPEFGCRLKQQLQTKDTSLRNTLISNEIELVANVLGRDYSTPINVREIIVEKDEKALYVEYNLTVILEIDGKEFSLNNINV